jgi:hypothetical protein
VSDGPTEQPPPDRQSFRRHPDGAAPSTPQPAQSEPAHSERAQSERAQSEPQTSIIRRHPTGAFPAVAEPQTSYLPRARPVAVRTPHPARAHPGAAIATAVASILTGWATAVIATDLISGWWRSDRLFCLAIGFLTAVSASALIGGLIALLLRRRIGQLVTVVGSVVALLIFAGLFVAGARLSPVVYAMPVLPGASVLLALLPATRRWTRP